MSRSMCPQEAAVLRAARTGEWPEALAAHAAQCRHCREIADTARWMQALAQSSEKNPALPDAKLVWWRAQLAEQRAKAERTRNALGWLEIASGTVVPLGLAGWVAWHWYEIQARATLLLTGELSQFPAAAYAVASLAPALLFLAAISLVYPLFIRE